MNNKTLKQQDFPKKVKKLLSIIAKKNIKNENCDISMRYMSPTLSRTAFAFQKA